MKHCYKSWIMYLERIWSFITKCKGTITLTLWRTRQSCLYYVQILPELKNRFVLKDVDLIFWGVIKVKNFWKFPGIKFSSLKLKLSGFAVKPPPMKGLKAESRHASSSKKVIRPSSSWRRTITSHYAHYLYGLSSFFIFVKLN